MKANFGDLHGPEGNVFFVLGTVKNLFHMGLANQHDESQELWQQLTSRLEKLTYDEILEWIEKLCRKYGVTIYAANWRGQNTEGVGVVKFSEKEENDA